MRSGKRSNISGEGTFLADFGRTERWVEKLGKVPRVLAERGRLPLSSSRLGSHVAHRGRVVGALQKIVHLWRGWGWDLGSLKPLFGQKAAVWVCFRGWPHGDW